MKNRYLLFLFLFVALSMTGCVANRLSSKARNAPLPSLNIPYAVQEVEIIDGRKYSSTEKMDLPFISMPSQVIVHRPAISATHKTIIENIIKENVQQTGMPVRAEVLIVDAYKEFSATWAYEKERGYAEMHLKLYDLESGKQILESGYSGEFYVKSADATTKRMEEVYQTTLRNVIYSNLKVIKNKSETVSQ